MARPLRMGGGGGKGLAFTFLFKFSLLKKDILLKMTYRNIHTQVYMLNFVIGQLSLCLLTGLLKYFPRNMTPKIGGGKQLSKPVPGYFKTKNKFRDH